MVEKLSLLYVFLHVATETNPVPRIEGDRLTKPPVTLVDVMAKMSNN